MFQVNRQPRYLTFVFDSPGTIRPTVRTLIRLLASRRCSLPSSSSLQCPSPPSPYRSACDWILRLPKSGLAADELELPSFPVACSAGLSPSGGEFWRGSSVRSAPLSMPMSAQGSASPSKSTSSSFHSFSRRIAPSTCAGSRLSAFAGMPDFFGIVHAHACPWILFIDHLHRVPLILQLACFASFGLSAFAVGPCGVFQFPHIPCSARPRQG